MLIVFALRYAAGSFQVLAGVGCKSIVRLFALALLALCAASAGQAAPRGEIAVMDEVFREGAMSAGSFSPRIPAGWREWRLDGAPKGPVGGLSKEHAYGSPNFHSLSIPVPERGVWGWESAQAPLRGRTRPPRLNFALRPSADFAGGAPVAILTFVDAQGAPLPVATQATIDLPLGDTSVWTERVVALDPVRIPEGAATFMVRLGVRRTDGPASGTIFFGLVRAMLPNADGTVARVRGAQPFNGFAFGDPVVFKPQGELPEGTTEVAGRVLDSEGREACVKTVDAATFATDGWHFTPKAPGHYSVVFTARTPAGNVLLADEYHDRAQNNQIGLFQPESHAFAVVRPRDADRPPATALGYHITCSNGRIRAMGDTEVRIAKLAGGSFARFHVTWPELEPAKGQFRWETLDYFVDKCREAGLEPAVCFYGTPRWASAKPDDARFFVHVWAYNAHPPRDLADWTDFIGAMVDRYRDDVRIWGVWNEPNLPGGSCYWHGMPEDFAAMLQAAHATIKGRQPDAEIWLDGTGSRYSEFYRRIVQLGAGGAFDKFGLHGHGANPAPLDRIDREYGVAPHGWVNSEWHAALQRYNSPAYAMSEPARALRMTLDFLRMLDLGASRAAYFEPFNLVEKEALRFHAEGGMPLNHSSGIFRQRPYLQPQYNAVVMANLGRWLSGDVAVDATYAFGNQRAAHLAGTRPLLVFWTTAEQPEPLDPRLLEALAGRTIEDWEGRQDTAAEGFMLKSQVLHAAELPEAPDDWPRASGVFSPRADVRPIQHTVEGVFGTRSILSASGAIAANVTWNDTGIRLHRLDGGAGDPAMRVRFAVAVLTNAVQLLVETTDTRHHQPAAGAAMWQGDSIEFAFDFEGRGATQDRLEFIASLTASGPELFKTANADVSGDLPTAWTMPGHAVRGARVVVDLDAKAGVTRYAVEIPAGECYPYAPSPERPLRFALVVNENDGETRAAVATWGGGVFPIKDAALYGDLKPAEHVDNSSLFGRKRKEMSVQHDTIRIRSFLQERPVDRAQRPTTIVATIVNVGDVDAELRPRLVLPKGVQLIGPAMDSPVRIGSRAEKHLAWQIEANEAKKCELLLQIDAGAETVASASLSMQFLPPVNISRQRYIPEPEPVPTPILIGAHHCPLWEADKPRMWDNVLKHPERTPALGFYSQENPEVSDWETKWAVEHGISFFIYCWYRTSQGEPVKMQFSSAIHDALFKSKFVDKMKFTIMWENQRRGKSGVADEADLMKNLLPFWIDNYFTHPSYLKIDNKPVLYVYRPQFLVQDLGGIENVAKAFNLMRAACREKGFDGLYILGEYRGLDPNHLELMKQLGLDYTFAYCWNLPNNPTPEQAIQAQMDNINKTQQLGVLPQVVTVSQAWSGWKDEGSIWKIPPSDFETLLRKAKDFISTLPADELGSKMLLLDNWNEWGEGHYLAPYREYGFGYVDAVRTVFAEDSGPHVDLIPEDIGFGPYDAAYKAHRQQEQQSRNEAAQELK